MRLPEFLLSNPKRKVPALADGGRRTADGGRRTADGAPGLQARHWQGLDFRQQGFAARNLAGTTLHLAP
jgi:hypothetical protein